MPMTIFQGMEKDAPETIEHAAEEREGLVETITVMTEYVKQMYPDGASEGLLLTIEKLKAKLSIVEDMLVHFKALVPSQSSQ